MEYGNGTSQNDFAKAQILNKYFHFHLLTKKPFTFQDFPVRDSKLTNFDIFKSAIGTTFLNLILVKQEGQMGTLQHLLPNPVWA